MKAPFALLALGLLLFLPAGSRADSCLTADCHASIRNLAHRHQPAADGECLSCHVQTGAEHPVKGGKSFGLVEKGSALCYQCHDAMGKMRVVHSPVKDGDCISCHNPHGAANRFLLAVGEDQSELCFGCHDSAPFKQEAMHSPVAVGACTICHSPHQSDQKSLLLLTVRELCLKCHQDFARQMQAATVVHPPVKNGPCTDCHDPHASSAPFVLKKKMPDICFDCHAEVGKRLASAKLKHKPIEQAGSCGICHSTHFSQAKGLLPTDEKSLCLRCHGVDNLGTPPLQNIKKQLEGKTHLHGPIQEGGCVPCHDPHGSDFSRLLKGQYPDGLYFPYQEGAYDLCLKCHDKQLLRFEETTLYTKFRNGNRNLHFVHVSDVRKGRTCRLCHETHASDGEKLISKGGLPFGDWKIPIRFVPTETGGSCAPGCHRALEYDRDKPKNYKQEEGS